MGQTNPIRNPQHACSLPQTQPSHRRWAHTHTPVTEAWRTHHQPDLAAAPDSWPYISPSRLGSESETRSWDSHESTPRAPLSAPPHVVFKQPFPSCCSYCNKPSPVGPPSYTGGNSKPGQPCARWCAPANFCSHPTYHLPGQVQLGTGWGLALPPATHPWPSQPWTVWTDGPTLSRPPQMLDAPSRFHTAPCWLYASFIHPSIQPVWAFFSI